MKYSILFIIFSISVYSCKPKTNSTVQADSPESLKGKKDHIDSIFRLKNNNLTVLVKVPNKPGLVEVKNENWPEEVETTYNLLKDPSGNVILFLESPYSESGDWNITFAHYFDVDGKTFAFTRQTNYFNSICTEGVAYETVTEFYDKAFAKEKTDYKLVDTSGHVLDKSKCEFPYDQQYKVVKDREACLLKLK
jgi:hypothetical protein